jgi:sRNA-binding protein
MATLIESLKAEIARMEAKHGSDDPFVKDLKEQLRASEETSGKTAHEVYRMQAFNFAVQEDEKPETEADGHRAEAIRRAQVRHAAKPVSPEQYQQREQRRQEQVHKRAEAIANADRDAPIRVRFHAWLERSGYSPKPIPVPGQSYSGSHMETLWEAYLDATLQERHATPNSACESSNVKE